MCVSVFICAYKRFECVLAVKEGKWQTNFCGCGGNSVGGYDGEEGVGATLSLALVW